MMHTLRSMLLSAAAATLMLGALSSCNSTRKAVYFRPDAKWTDSVVYSNNTVPVPEAILRAGDIVAVNVSSISSTLMEEKADPVQPFREGGTIFNLAPSMNGVQGGGGGGAVQGSRLGYLIDQEGNIAFPVVGKIALAGLTTRQAKDRISGKLVTLLKDPVVELRILNFKVVVLGDVASPGTVIAPGHNISILEAMAAAGDVTITGDKENVMLIRNDNNGTQTHVHLNLTSRDILTSPYYYLQQGDVLYVKPTPVRLQQNNEFLRIYLPAITSLLSTVVTAYGLIRISQAN